MAIREAASRVEGVLRVGNVRCRTMSSNALTSDVTILIEPKSSASAAQKLAGRVREAVTTTLGWLPYWGTGTLKVWWNEPRHVLRTCGVLVRP